MSMMPVPLPIFAFAKCVIASLMACSIFSSAIRSHSGGPFGFSSRMTGALWVCEAASNRHEIPLLRCAAAFSRSNEEEADYIGLLYMARAGYDPRESIKFWERMSKVGGAGQKPPEFASTHPSDQTRIQRLTDEMPKALEEFNKSPFRGQP